MGLSMARNIATSGQLSAVWNRSRPPAIELEKAFGLEFCVDPAHLAEKCEAIFICVSADQDVLQVVERLLPGLQTGHVVVDLSTVSSETARKSAALIERQGAAFLDSPVSGGVEGARNGTLAMMVGGDPDCLDRVMPVMESMGKRIVHMGPVGAGQATKAVNQIMAAGVNQAVTEALAFGERQGLPLDRLIDVIAGGAAGNWFLEHRGRSMTQSRFNPGFKIKLHHKDLLICRNMARQMRFNSTIVDSTLDDYSKLMSEGFGEEDISALYRLKRS